MSQEVIQITPYTFIGGAKSEAKKAKRDQVDVH